MLWKNDITHIWEIIFKDLKSAYKNPVVTLLLIGIIILPSLYAILNIQACWDPYGNTNDVQFAIANLDNGTSFEGEYINIGDQIEDELKENNNFDWTFVSEKELRDGVYNGTYYAGIVIPENLSENVISITDKNPQQAKLEYIVNMKTNPVASKLTDNAANTVYTSLNAKIVQVINLAAYDKLGDLQSGLSSGSSQLASGGSQIQSGASQVSSGASEVSSGASEVSSGADQVKSNANQLSSGASQVSSSASQIESGSSKLSESASQLEKSSSDLQNAVDTSTLPDGPIKEYAESNSKLAAGSGQVASGANSLANGSAALANGSVKLANGSVQLANGSVALADGSLQLAEGSLSLAAGAELLSTSAAQALFSASAALGSSANSLSGITGINEDDLENYFLAPVELERNEVFPVNSYGSDVAPFYLVLSMWVGGILTCVMLKKGSSEGTKYTPTEIYFGKLFIFIILSILQACVTIIGSFLLGIQISNPVMFIFSAIFISVVFMILMYSLTSALGTVGEGLAVILLVLQISGTGGIYPIEIMHPFFKTLYPFMPMTYAIDLIRESQLGLIWSNYLPAFFILVAIAIVTVVISLVIKKKSDAPLHYLEKRLEESGLF